MRLMNVLLDGEPRLGLVKEGGTLDLTLLLKEKGLEVRSTDDLIRLGLSESGWDLASALPLDPGLPLLPAVLHPGKIACAGLNYLQHVENTKSKPPKDPCFFAKYRSALNAHRGAIVPPRGAAKVDYEGELALVIGKGGRNIPEDRVTDHLFGLTVANDVSARDLQFRTTQWLAGKTPDTFLPIGPELVTLDEVRDPQDLRIRTWVNGELMQEDRTSDMIFSIAKLVSTLSEIVTLEGGDLILTGTPSGPQTEKENPRWLTDGDVVTVEIEGVGRLENTVRSA